MARSFFSRLSTTQILKTATVSGTTSTLSLGRAELTPSREIIVVAPTVFRLLDVDVTSVRAFDGEEDE